VSRGQETRHSNDVPTQGVMHALRHVVQFRKAVRNKDGRMARVLLCRGSVVPRDQSRRNSQMSL
jgi:hypothetical protein